MATSKKRWSGRVTRESNALDLEHEVFKKSPHEIARSLKRSAENSKRRKSSPFRSAMSMLTFYVNRAGKNLPQSRVKVLNDAKDELRALYGKTQGKSRGKPQKRASQRSRARRKSA